MSLNGKKVSIIIPAFNVGKYIADCLNSLINQTYENLEIIIVNDGSNDDTDNIIRGYLLDNPRIIYVEKVNEGVSVARNTALEKASGDYCMFLDGDDFLEDFDAIKRLVDRYEAADCDLLAFSYNRYDENRKRLDNYGFKFGEFTVDTDEKKVDFLINHFLKYEIGYEVWDKLYDMSIIRDKNIRFAKDSKMGEDIGFNLLYLSYVKKIYSVDDRAYGYRIRTGSAMNNDSLKANSLNGYLAFLSALHKEYKSRELDLLSEQFSCIFTVSLDNVFRSYNDKEIAEMIEQSDKVFFIRETKKLIRRKEVFDICYEEDVKNPARRHYMYILMLLGKLSIADRIYLLVNELYRKVRGREKLIDERHRY